MTQIIVTDIATNKVRIDVATYAGVVMIRLKLSRVNPGRTNEVNGSTNQNAVINNRKRERM